MVEFKVRFEFDPCLERRFYSFRGPALLTENIYSIFTSGRITLLGVADNFGGFMDFIVAGLIGGAVLIYLTYALFNPDKF